MSALPLTLFGVCDPELRSLARPDRTTLDPCCWIDHCSEFVLGGDTLFAELEDTIDWFRGKRLMYGTWHREPRLTGQDPLPGKLVPPLIDVMRDALGLRYDRAFTGLFCNFYESGSDSVAWHADRIGRTEVDPSVAILSLGGPRTFHLRPQHGGKSHQFRLCSGDLLVMGGATQHHWEHAVPKVALAPPRMSVTMRAGGPRLSVIPPLPESPLTNRPLPLPNEPSNVARLRPLRRRATPPEP